MLYQFNKGEIWQRQLGIIMHPTARLINIFAHNNKTFHVTASSFKKKGKIISEWYMLIEYRKPIDITKESRKYSGPTHGYRMKHLLTHPNCFHFLVTLVHLVEISYYGNRLSDVSSPLRTPVRHFTLFFFSNI